MNVMPRLLAVPDRLPWLVKVRVWLCTGIWV